MKVSIVIPTYNNVHLIENCLESLFKHVTAEIIVVDNGSRDKSLKTFSEPVVYLKLPENTGFAHACNLGAKIAQNEFILFLNNDTIIHNNFVSTMMDAFRNGVGIVGGKLLYPDTTIQHSGIEIDIDSNGKLQGRNTKENMPSREVVAVTGALMAIRKNAFFDAGGFDETYWNGNEDVDLCLKMRMDGWKVYYESSIVVTHIESQSGPERWSAVDRNVDRLTEKWIEKDALWRNP